MADTDIVQVIAEARIDARSLSEFVFKPAGFKVARRLAPTVDTLQFYIDRFNSLNGDFSSSVSVALSSLNNSVAEADGKVAYIETTVQDAINQSILSSGFVTIDSFELGATITQRNEALRHAADGKLYRWAGDLPKVVAASSTPANSGGSGDNAWLEVSDTALRQELAVEYGVSNAANSIVTVDNVAELEALPENAKREDLRYLVKEYHAGSNVGGGLFEYAPTSPFADDGGRRIGDFVRVETTYDTPFTFANYGYDFENHSISAQVIAQKIFDTIEALPIEYHAIIEISDGVIFTDGVARLTRGNFTLRGEGTFYVSGASANEQTYALRFLEILITEGRRDNVIIKDLRMIGMFDGTLEDFYGENRGLHIARRLYVHGANGIRVSNIYAKRISIPVDVRSSTNVQISNVTLVEGNCAVSLISSKYVNISDITAVEYSGAVVDFSDVQYGSVTNIVGYVSEAGRDLAEECMDIGSSKDLVISNVYSYGPTKNMIRIKFEDVEQPFSNLRFSNLVCRDAIFGIIIQSSTNNTGELTEHIHIDGVNMITDDACVAMSGTTHVYNVSVNNFHLISRNGSPLGLDKMSDVSISNGYAFCESMRKVGRPAIRLGNSSIRDGIFGKRVRVSNVRVGSTNDRSEVISVIGSEDVTMSDVTVTEGYMDGLTITDSRNVKLSNMHFNNLTAGCAILATFSSGKFGEEVDANLYIKSCTFTDYGIQLDYMAGVRLVADGVKVNKVVITDNNASISSTLPPFIKRLVVVAAPNGGSFGAGSIIARNTASGFPTMITGSLGGILVKDNDKLDGNYTEPEPEV